MALDPHGHKAIHRVSGISMFPRAMRTTDGRNSLEVYLYAEIVQLMGRGLASEPNAKHTSGWMFWAAGHKSRGVIIVVKELRTVITFSQGTHRRSLLPKVWP